MTSGDDRRLWERHAQWWIDGFTDGADPEYTEQILPLAAAELTRRPAGARRRLRRRPDQPARAPARRRVDRSVGIDPTWNQITVAAARGGATGFVRAGAAGCRSPTAPFDAVVACLVFEHIDAVDEAIAEVARVLAPGGRFCFFLNHPLLQTPGSGWIDDQILDPPEQYWRIGPYLPEAVTIEEVELGVHIRFVHRPLSRTSTRSPTTGCCSSGWSSRRRRRASWPWPRSTPSSDGAPAAVSPDAPNRVG